MAGAYVKLFGSILTSSIWCEGKDTRLVWITMLLLADSDGRVWGAVPGIARQAGVSVKAARAALDVLAQPDEDSRSEEDEGRRILAIPGGWQIVNSRKYREMQSDGTRKDLSEVRAEAGRRGAEARWGNSKMAKDGKSRQRMPEVEEESEGKNNGSSPPRAQERPATETRPAFGVLLDEATCPACKNRGTLRQAGRGNGLFCGTKLGGCGQTFDYLEPSILQQLTPGAKKSFEDRVAAQIAAASPRAVPPPPPPDPAIAAAEEDAWNRLPALVDEFLAWYAENPEAGETLGRRGYHGQAFGGWPGGRDIPPGPKDAVLKAAVKKLKAPEGARRVG